MKMFSENWLEEANSFVSEFVSTEKQKRWEEYVKGGGAE